MPQVSFWWVVYGWGCAALFTAVITWFILRVSQRRIGELEGLLLEQHAAMHRMDKMIDSCLEQLVITGHPGAAEVLEQKRASQAPHHPVTEQPLPNRIH